MSIPKRILQIALGAEYIQTLPLSLLKNNLLELNGDYEYILLTDAVCINFIKTFYPKYITLYDALPRPQHKSDLVRYLYIYHYGGFYIDIDLLPSVSFDYLQTHINNTTSFYTIGAHDYGKTQMANGFFGSIAGNDILLELADKMVVSQDYAVNIIQMYNTLSEKYGKVEPFYFIKDVYFLREISTNKGYHIYVNNSTHVCNSNDNNYPPKINKSEPKVYLTYNNDAHPDGTGAQMVRIILLYLAAKKFNLEYIFSPMQKATYQGLECLINNKGDQSKVTEFNNLLEFEQTSNIVFDEEHSVSHLSHNLLNQMLSIKPSHNILIKCTYCALVDEGMVDLLDIKLPFSWIERTIRNPLIVAIHIRRGELYVVDSDRMYPNTYYIEIMTALIDILEDIPHELHIHTENVTQDVIITPEHHGIMNRTTQNIVLTPNDNKFEDFNCFPQAIFHINEDSVKTFKDLVNSDILLGSYSAFSYSAAILNSKGVVLLHPFTHRLSDKWISTTTAEDIYKNKDIILEKLHNY